MKLLDLLFGRKLATREQGTRKLGWLEAVPAMGLDGLGSASYGPEAALTVLIPLGAASLAWIVPVTIPVVLLLVILYLSYRQTVLAYPSNGGAYVVAKENLGRGASLVAAAALMVDYTLNVAVGISAGIGALTSSLPALQPYTLALCLAILALITVANLRGTRETGLVFAVPTYLFIASFLGVIAVGLWKVVASGGAPEPVVPPPHAADAAEAVGLWLLVRSFSAGCTAMTGVEAVSNGVSSLKEPVVREARITLTVICLVLGLMLAGISVVASRYGIAAMDQTKPEYQSVMSQLAGAVVGRGAIYSVAMASLLAVLCLSANTSFVGFPRLCRVVAADGFLPGTFAVADRRLVFSIGIAVLTVSAALLLIAFGGITDRLIPLFAIGAFLTFTMSQAGMVAHWRRQAERHRGRLAINAAGAVTTAVALAVILVAKFAEGAWIVLLVIPLVIALLVRIRRYHDEIERDLAARGPFSVAETEPPTLLVAFERRSRMTDRALEFAMTLSPDVIAIHMLRLEGPETEDDGKALREVWEREIAGPLAGRGLTPPRLVLLPSPFREIHGPLLKLIDKLDVATPGRSVAVLVPELVRRSWWERLLHSDRAEHLRRMLLRHGGERVNVITVPWRR